MKNNDNKKRIIYIAAIVLVVAVIAVGTISILRISGTKTTNNSKDTTNSQTKTQTTATKTTADSLLSQGIKAIDSKDIPKAKTLLKEARQQYVELKNNNGVSNVDAELYYADHQAPAPKGRTKPIDAVVVNA